MEIRKDKDKIIVEIPYWEYRSNPYMPEESEKKLLGKYKTLTGLIIRHNKNGNDWDEIGWAQTIDRDYKNKGDDVGDFVVKWYDGEEEFKAKCKELELNIVEMNL